jgi:hypothetical protein
MSLGDSIAQNICVIREKSREQGSARTTANLFTISLKDIVISLHLTIRVLGLMNVDWGNSDGPRRMVFDFDSANHLSAGDDRRVLHGPTAAVICPQDVSGGVARDLGPSTACC